MKRLATYIPPLAGVGVFAVDYAAGDSLNEALWNGLGAAFLAALNVVFWVTFGFVLAERSEAVEEEVTPFTTWTVDRLPTVKTLDRQFSLAETIGAVVFQLVIILVLSRKTVCGQSRSSISMPGAGQWRRSSAWSRSRPFFRS